MKKILFVATVASHIKSFHLPYLKLLKENGYKVYVAANWNLDEDYKLEYCDEFIQIPIQRSPYSIENIKAVKELKKIINKEKLDIIHCHTPMGSVVTRLAAKKTRKVGTRVIYTAHGFHFYKGAPLINWLLFYPVEWYLARYTDTIITINKEDYERAKNKFSGRCKDIQYVPGVGIDTTKFDIKISDDEIHKLRESLGLKNEDFVLTCVARLDRNKNQEFLINVMQELVKKNKNIHLLLVGRDELNGYYQAIVKEKGLEKNIHFLGNRNDVPQLLKISDVGVSASIREGLGLNLLEELYSGIPVIATDNRGHRDIIKNDINGYLIYNSDQSYFVNKVKELYLEEAKRERMSMQAQNSVEKFMLENILSKMKKIYKV